ncbi:MAG TPA: HD domain-containing phosphohydrolase [Geobacteraceae bacterium]|nr:HD domain-containing phosphohydrolase [Geobacteraceae bacterium]
MSEDISQHAAQRAAMLLTASIKSVMFYPQAHPAVKQPLQELTAIFDDMLKERPELHLGVVEGVFFLESHLFVSPNAAVAELSERLTKKGIDALTIYSGVVADDLFLFASLLARRDTTSDLVSEELTKNGIKTIRLGIDYLVYGDTADESGSAPSRTYQDAINAVRYTMAEVENGRIPSSERINTVVGNMVSQTIKDHTTLLGLAMIKDYDNYTFNHSVNVGILALALGAYMGLSREVLRDTNTAGLLHDIGKTGIDKNILNKPGKLSAEEYEQIKKHSEKGAEIINRMEDIDARVAEAVLGHHIKFNRTGYPEWARGMNFDYITEIVAVADCYDAITTVRTYSMPVLPKAALDTMHRLEGTALNGELVGKFEEMMGRYPVGTLVRLDTNEIALVVRPHPMKSRAPTLKVIIDRSGDVLEKPYLKSIVAPDGSLQESIVAIVDPLMKNVDVARYFST